MPDVTMTGPKGAGIVFEQWETIGRAGKKAVITFFEAIAGSPIFYNNTMTSSHHNALSDSCFYLSCWG